MSPLNSIRVGLLGTLLLALTTAALARTAPVGEETGLRAALLVPGTSGPSSTAALPTTQADAAEGRAFERYLDMHNDATGHAPYTSQMLTAGVLPTLGCGSPEVSVH